MTPRLPGIAGVALALLVPAMAAGGAPGDRPADVGLGHAREVPSAWSASRDAPAFALALAPRGTRAAGGEFALATLPLGGLTLRPGFYGLLELEGDSSEAALRGWPSQEIHFWRGAYGIQVALSLDGLAAGMCDGCGLEATAMFRHESEHHTASNEGGAGPDYADRPLHGDALVVDVATRILSGDWLLLVRGACSAFLPGRSSYRLGPALDLHLRWVGSQRAQPFVSAYAEYRIGTWYEGLAYPDAYLTRALAGVALPSALGDVMLFASADVGHRRGLAAVEEEATLGLGIRLAIGAGAEDGR